MYPLKSAPLGRYCRSSPLVFPLMPRCLHRLDQLQKIEGIDGRVVDDVIHLLLVTDADDAEIPYNLYSVMLTLPRPVG